MANLDFFLAHYYDGNKSQYIPFHYTNIAQNVLLNTESDETVSDALNQLGASASFTTDELLAHIGNHSVHADAAHIQNALEAVTELTVHKDNSGIHVSPGEKSQWSAGVVTANEAKELITLLTQKVNLFESRISRLEDGLFSNITGNPFLVSFGSLTDANITKGIWNKDKQWVEC